MRRLTSEGVAAQEGKNADAELETGMGESCQQYDGEGAECVEVAHVFVLFPFTHILPQAVSEVKKVEDFCKKVLLFYKVYAILKIAI